MGEEAPKELQSYIGVKKRGLFWCLDVMVIEIRDSGGRSLVALCNGTEGHIRHLPLV